MNIQEMITEINSLFEIYQAWFALLGLVFTFIRLYQWARNKKTGALVIGLLVQMILPDPQVEQTIKVVQEKKQTTIQSQRKSNGAQENQQSSALKNNEN